jgi:hypothetical protein
VLNSLIMSTFNLASAVRQQTDAAQLQTLDLEDLIDHVQATDLQIVIDKKRSTERLQVVGPKGYLSVRIGDKVDLTETGVARIRELVDNYHIYCGISDDGHPWMTFGPEPTGNEPVATVKVATFLSA